jgi:lactate dehydrogenase-like 2-hydroxyacid dehydrogenase
VHIQLLCHAEDSHVRVGSPQSVAQVLTDRTRNVGPSAMSLLEASPFELIVNPEDAPAPREWVLKHLADEEVMGVCIMHGQPGDKVDAEFLGAANRGLKVVSTFSVGYGELFRREVL